MPSDTARNPRGFVLLASNQISEDGLQWIEVMPTAEKARNGRWYFTVTADDLETFAESIRSQPGLIPVDYDHQAAEGSSRAAGWFTGQANVEDGVLLAEVKWTPKAVEEIQSGEYKRISPEFSFHDRDKTTGLMTKAKQILAATLTNRPFFRELAPVGTDVVWDAREGWQQLQQRVNAALNPGSIEDARYYVLDITTGKALVEEYRAQRTWVAPYEQATDGSVMVAPESDWTLAEREWVAASREAIRQNTARRPFRTKERDMDTSVIAKTLGLAEDATDEQIEQAVKAAAAKAAELEPGRVEKLEQELAGERVKRVLAERDQVLTDAVREHRIVPAQKESLTVAFGADSPTDEQVTALKTLVGTFPVRQTGEIGTGGEGETEPDITTARSQFTLTDGRRELTPVDEDVALHVKATEILAGRGKTTYTADEYVAAVTEARAAVAA